MLSKNSKNPSIPLTLWKDAPNCDEPQLEQIAAELATQLRPGAWVLLEGPMGAGKSTFARALLRGLNDDLPPEGSPTFAIAHEYEQPGRLRLIHLDLYRIEKPEEFEAAGVSAYFWENPDAVVLSEWTSRWPELQENLLAETRHDRWVVQLEFSHQQDRRDLRVLRA